ncbi:MAG: hypothetical protein ACP5N1_05255 [Candidatus Woesearchaeota archaeon]
MKEQLKKDIIIEHPIENVNYHIGKLKNEEYIGKIAIYKNPDSQRYWLIKITQNEYKKCKDDFFKHYYLSGNSILLDYSKGELVALPDIRTGSSNIRKKNVILIDDKDLEALFD